MVRRGLVEKGRILRTSSAGAGGAVPGVALEVVGALVTVAATLAGVGGGIAVHGGNTHGSDVGVGRGGRLAGPAEGR